MANVEVLAETLCKSTDNDLAEIGAEITRLLDLKGLLAALDDADTVEDFAKVLINDTVDPEFQELGNKLWERIQFPEWDDEFLLAREGLEFCVNAARALAAVSESARASMLVNDAAEFILAMSEASLLETGRLAQSTFEEIDLTAKLREVAAGNDKPAAVLRGANMGVFEGADLADLIPPPGEPPQEPDYREDPNHQSLQELIDSQPPDFQEEEPL